MKVALMLTGLARKVQEGFDGYWKYIIENNDVDLYLHAWESKPDKITNNEDSDDVLKVYPNPKYINIQKPIKFTKYREGIKTPRDDKSRPLVDFDVFSNFRAFPMLYGWQETYKKIQESNIKYDCIIRSRYDIAGLNLEISDYDLTKIYTSNSHWPNSPIHDDNFYMSNQENSDKVFPTIFDNIVDYNREQGIMDGAEQNFTKYLHRIQLYDNAIKHDGINFDLLRDDKVWWPEDIK
tara:strand:- start:938 stop:1648 length:711 start_codon:yes stop_codon:yes gene_type:complete